MVLLNKILKTFLWRIFQNTTNFIGKFFNNNREYLKVFSATLFQIIDRYEHDCT